MNLYVRVSKKSDADLIELYKYLPHGLGSLFKSILLDYFKFYTPENGEYKFIPPTLKRKNKRPQNDAMIIKIFFSDEESEAIKGLNRLLKGGRGPFIKNLTRMYMSFNLSELVRPIFGEAVGDFRQKNKDIPKEVQRNDTPKIIPEKPKKMFTPQEF